MDHTLSVAMTAAQMLGIHASVWALTWKHMRDAGDLLFQLLGSIGALLQAFTAVVAFVFSFIVWKRGERADHAIREHARRTEEVARQHMVCLERALFHRSIMESWITTNATILARPELARVSNAIWGHVPNAELADEEMYDEKRHIAFMYLNVLEMHYRGIEGQVIEDTDRDSLAQHIVRPLLANPVVSDVLEKAGYSENFRNYIKAML